MILADKIINLRKREGWSQEELADRLGVSRQSISKWEGAQSIPDMKKILAMADLFGVSTDYLLTGEVTEKDQLLLSDKMRKLTAAQLRTIENIVDECIALNEKAEK